MDKNTVIGLVLIFLLFIGFSIWNAPSEEEKEALRIEQDSLAHIRREKAMLEEVIAMENEDTNKVVVDMLPTQMQDVAQFGSFSQASVGEEEFIEVENKFIKFSFSNLGGRISSVEMKDLKTFDDRPLVLFSSENGNMGISFFSNNLLIETGKMYFDVLINNKIPSKTNFDVAENDSLTVQYRLYPNLTDSLKDDTRFVEMAYTIYADKYMSDFNISVVNMDGVIQNNTTSFELQWNSKINRSEKSYENELKNTTAFWKDSEEIGRAACRERV